MHDIVLSSHGRYVFAQSGGGWEIREAVDARRRVRWALGGLLLGAGAVVWEGARHPFAIPLAALGAALVIAGSRKKGRRLVIRDAEIAWGYTGDDPVRTALWPRSRIARVVIEHGSRLADPKLRRRIPLWTVRIQAREGDLHPASFAFSAEPAARELAETLARHLSVAVGAVEPASATAASIKPSRPRSGPRRSGGTAPKPGRLDPR